MKKKIGLLIIITIAAIVLAVGCKNPSSGGVADNGVKYAIGDIGPSGVGLVFYITEGGLHGYEVAPEDQKTIADWSNITSGFVNGSSALPTGIGSGASNTDLIIKQAGHTDSAAKICRDYRSSEEGDWFLPSKEELNKIWVNLV